MKESRCQHKSILFYERDTSSREGEMGLWLSSGGQTLAQQLGTRHSIFPIASADLKGYLYGERH
jgi:hypothetical protein